MRKLWMIIVLTLVLSGCGTAETFETVADLMQPGSPPEPKQVVVEIPQEASSGVMEGESSELYLCDGYEIALQTMEAGDLNRSIQCITGYQPEELTLIKTGDQSMTRYDFVWSVAGEQGDQVGRGILLDDGYYHYTLTTLGNAQDYEQLKPVWEELFDSFGVTQY